MADLQCEVESNKVVSGEADELVNCDKTDSLEEINSISEGPLDSSLLMDLGFIKRILDNLVSPAETQVVLDMAVEYIKQDTGNLLQTQSDNFKSLEAKLTVLDSDKDKVKAKVLHCQEKVTSLKETVTENQTKLKSVVGQSNPVMDSHNS